MKQLVKKLITGMTVTLFALTQTPLGVIFNTIPEASATITNITISAPSGGYVGGTPVINWATTPVEDPDNVDIYYCKDNGCLLGDDWNPITVALNAPNNGVYTGWDTTGIGNGSGYKVIVTRAGYMPTLRISNAFEIYNYDYEEEDTTGMSINQDDPVETNTGTTLSASEYGPEPYIPWINYLWTMDS